MNILWHMPTLHRAMCGLSIRANRLAAELVRRGHAVTFVVSAAKTDAGSATMGGIPVIQTQAGKGGSIHWSLQARARLRNAHRQIAAIDAAHDLFITCQPEAVIAYRARRPQSPAIFVCGGTTILHDAADRAREAGLPFATKFSFALDRRLKKSNERAAFHAADAIVFDSESTCRRVIATHRVPEEKCHPILGGVDPARHRRPTADERAVARLDLGIAPGETVALWTGRISIEKNLAPLIESLAICRHRPDWFFLVGDGADAPALRARVESLGLGDRVRFAGCHDDVRHFLFAADYFIFPSAAESFGGSLAEAMACGLPCIALRADERTICNASVEILDQGRSGLIVDRNEPQLFADAIDRLNSDPVLRDTLGTRGEPRRNPFLLGPGWRATQ